MSPNYITATLCGTVANQINNNLVPNRKARRNIPNENLLLPLQPGALLPSEAGAKDRYTIWKGQVETEVSDPLRRPMVSNNEVINSNK
jgi:hypothetical protein